MSLLRSWFGGPSAAAEIARVNRRRVELANAAASRSSEALREAFRNSEDLAETVAIVGVVAARTVGMEMFDVQLQGALALGRGRWLRCRPAKARRWLYARRRVVRSRGSRRPRDDRQRLPRPARRQMDGRDL